MGKGIDARTLVHRGMHYVVSEAHPAAEAFPWLPEAELQALADDIKTHGQNYKIARLPDGRVVDGRNREFACRIAGDEPQYVELDAITDAEVVELVKSRNVHRRHMEPSQRAMIAALLTNIAHGGDRKSDAIKASRDALISQTKSAKEFDVSRASVQRAEVVEKKAPELVEAVKDGSLDVHTAAKAAELPKPARKRIAKADNPKQAAKEELAKADAVEVVQPTAVDEWEIPIQPHAVDAFAAVPKFKELISAIKHAQRLFNEVANLSGGKFLTLPDVSSYRRGKKGDDGEHADRFVHDGLETALRQVKNATPTHTVCPWNYVEAPHPDDCRTCCGLNWTPVLSDNIPAAAISKAKSEFVVKEVA